MFGNEVDCRFSFSQNMILFVICFLLGYSPASVVGHLNYRRRGITQKKAYNIQNTVKVWNQEWFYLINWTSSDVAPQIKINKLINQYWRLCHSMNYPLYPVRSFTYREQVGVDEVQRVIVYMLSKNIMSTAIQRTKIHEGDQWENRNIS
jgi:hypothetical protein